jgi:hypothetical protein
VFEWTLFFIWVCKCVVIVATIGWTSVRLGVESIAKYDGWFVWICGKCVFLFDLI